MTQPWASSAAPPWMFASARSVDAGGGVVPGGGMPAMTAQKRPWVAEERLEAIPMVHKSLDAGIAAGMICGGCNYPLEIRLRLDPCFHLLCLHCYNVKSQIESRRKPLPFDCPTCAIETSGAVILHPSDPVHACSGTCVLQLPAAASTTTSAATAAPNLPPVLQQEVSSAGRGRIFLNQMSLRCHNMFFHPKEVVPSTSFDDSPSLPDQPVPSLIAPDVGQAYLPSQPSAPAAAAPFEAIPHTSAVSTGPADPLGVPQSLYEDPDYHSNFALQQSTLGAIPSTSGATAPMRYAVGESRSSETGSSSNFFAATPAPAPAQLPYTWAVGENGSAFEGVPGQFTSNSSVSGNFRLGEHGNFGDQGQHVAPMGGRGMEAGLGAVFGQTRRGGEMEDDLEDLIM